MDFGLLEWIASGELLNPIYVLTIFVAGGIYFLFKRYEHVKYRAVPFNIKPPAVRIIRFVFKASLADRTTAHYTYFFTTNHIIGGFVWMDIGYHYESGSRISFDELELDSTS